MSKIQLQDFVKYGKLFAIYGKLLSEDRQNIMTSYFEFNMTLVEIAEEKNISRQAVLDAIAKSCKKLDEFEAKLQIDKQKQMLSEELQQLKKLANDKKIEEKVDNILRKM